jgi:adenylylsulfate kinase-like enzyme
MQEKRNLVFLYFFIWIKGMNSLRAHVIWLTGLSDSGKTTIANDLETVLKSIRIKTRILDSDILNVINTLEVDSGIVKSEERYLLQKDTLITCAINIEKIFQMIF